MDEKGHWIKLKSYDSKQTFFILNKYKLDIDCKILKIEWRGYIFFYQQLYFLSVD